MLECCTVQVFCQLFYLSKQSMFLDENASNIKCAFFTGCGPMATLLCTSLFWSPISLPLSYIRLFKNWEGKVGEQNGNLACCIRMTGAGRFHTAEGCPFLSSCGIVGALLGLLKILSEPRQVVLGTPFLVDLLACCRDRSYAFLIHNTFYVHCVCAESTK